MSNESMIAYYIPILSLRASNLLASHLTANDFNLNSRSLRLKEKRRITIADSANSSPLELSENKLSNRSKQSLFRERTPSGGIVNGEKGVVNKI